MSSCKKCGEEYTSVYSKWCKPCQIDNFKGNFTNWTSGNEKIDNFVQEMQLKINSSLDIVFEWIPYDQFSNIKEISRSFVTIWKNGPLYYNYNSKKYTRISDYKVVLKW